MSRADRPIDTPPQDVRFCRSADGTRLAFAVHGAGPPLLLASCWLSHLEFDWQSPVWRHFLLDLGRFATVVRHDERGYGMSDWDVSDFGLSRRVADLEAVADAAGLQRFALLGMSQGGPVAITHATRHPERPAPCPAGPRVPDVVPRTGMDPVRHQGAGLPPASPT